ncbi:MAG: DUF3313 domain-containing protein [Planctomycetota bacterium]|jgi:hypothetical protein
MRSTSVLVIIVVAALSAACKSNEYSGFLGDYSGLEPSKKHPGDLVWLKPGMDLRKYDYLLIDPIVIMARKGSETDKLSPELKKKATDAFYEILFETIDPYYTVVKKNGPHVLRVRIALTDLVPTDDKNMQVGGAALEVEVADSLTNQRLGIAISRIKGSTADTGKAKDKKWRAVEGAFNEWAQSLLDLMDSHHKDAPIEGA